MNKSEAERCRDMGATALRNGQTARAVKLLKKSLSLYPLPGVQALLSQAERKNESDSNTRNNTTNNTNNNNTSSSSAAAASTNGRTHSIPQRSASNVSSSSTTNSTPAPTSGRPYTDDQVRIVKEVLKAKEGGRGAHYRVLGVAQDANDAALKKAYRKLALKLHPDKNSAPQSDEAFKAVGLAYATLSDSQKRTIYDRYGEEDPDNRGGGARPGNVHFNGQEVNPEDIFNMFFGGGMPGGVHMGGMPGGFRVYSTGFGGGGGFGGRMPRQQQRQRGQRQQQEEEPPNLFHQLMNLLPLFLLMMMSFFNFGEQATTTQTGNNPYFSLTVCSFHHFLFSTIYYIFIYICIYAFYSLIFTHVFRYNILLFSRNYSIRLRLLIHYKLSLQE